MPDDEREMRARIRRYATGKKSRRRILDRITSDMGQHLACARCGLENVIGKGDMKPCTNCGGMVFVPYRYLPWDAAITQFDLDFLKCNKISPA